MRFMTLWRPAKTANSPSEQMFSEMGKLIEGMTRSGVLVQTGGWDPSGPCTLVRSSGGKISLTDGPYAEAKEVIAGFALLEVKTKEEALEHTRRFLAVAGDGVSEVREIPSAPPRAR